MDNMATGFAFGMGADDFANMDFQTSMAGDGEGGQPSSLMPGMSQFPSFGPAMPRDAMFSQASMMPSRVSSMDMPRFSGGAYGGGINSVSAGNFNSLMSARHSFSTGGMPGFGDMFQQQMAGSDTRGAGGGMMDNMADHMPGFGGVMSPPAATSSPSVMPSSMPVFPNTPSNMMHTAIGAQDLNHKPEDSDRGGMNGGGGLRTDPESVMQSPSGGYKSPIQSPPPPPQSLQTCFPGQMAPSIQQQPQQQQQQQQPQHSGSQTLCGPGMHQPSRNPSSQRAGFKEEKDFSGGPTDPIAPLIIGSAVTPMQRRRQSPRRAAMAAQEMAAAAAAALAIETKQVPMPPMLSSRESHLLSSIPQSMGYSMAGSSPLFNSSPRQSIQGAFPYSTSPRRSRRGRPSGAENTLHHQPHFDPPTSATTDSNFPHHRRTIVPFFKAGCLSVREPEVFECQSRKVPLITEGTQTGQDSREEELVSVADKPYLPADPRYSNVDPRDGKGGFPLSVYSLHPQFHNSAVKKATAVAEGSYRGFTEGEGYAKRGNSKTVVSPSFGEAAGRAVMTTCVSDSATVVTVAIMSRQKPALRSRVTSSLLSPRPSTSHDPGDDLKENMMKSTSLSDNLDSSNPDNSPPSGVQTRRGRRLNSSAPTMPTISSRGRTLRRRTNPDNISIEDDDNFELMMEERKEKARAAEQERMEVRWCETAWTDTRVVI